MDSCRYDSFVQARTPHMDRVGGAERRFSFASWTSPSHYTFLMGQVPHTSPRGVFASEVYKAEYAKWIERLGVPRLSFKSFVPHLCLPKVLKDLGYRTVARVSMPVLNGLAGFSRFFDDYKLMESHCDFEGIVREIEFDRSQPHFFFLNLGETHYPYMLQDRQLPHISGVHGVLGNLDDLVVRTGDQANEPGQEFFSQEAMESLHQQQVRCVECIDRIFIDLLHKCPAGDTHMIVTADHGELFGEGGYFGHGPVMHEKCFEVPFLEGEVRVR